MLITIDGKSGHGKSTVGPMLADKLGASFFSSGLLIRFLAHQYQQLSSEGIAEDDIFESLYNKISVETILHLQNHRNTELYETGLTEYFGIITSNKKMLKIVDGALGDYCKGKDVIMDGRNLYEIFPDANFKFYFESSLEKRSELMQLSKQVTIEESLERIQSRDCQERRLIVTYSELIVMDPLSHSLDELLELMYKRVVR